LHTRTRVTHKGGFFLAACASLRIYMLKQLGIYSHQNESCKSHSHYPLFETNTAGEEGPPTIQSAWELEPPAPCMVVSCRPGHGSAKSRSVSPRFTPSTVNRNFRMLRTESTSTTFPTSYMSKTKAFHRDPTSQGLQFTTPCQYSADAQLVMVMLAECLVGHARHSVPVHS
jgi:hypothetical protein